MGTKNNHLDVGIINLITIKPRQKMGKINPRVVSL